MNMGAGRIVYQELTRITKEIQDGDFFKNEALLKAIDNCKKNDSALHLMGLLSDGGVHSHITHLYGLLELAKQYNVQMPSDQLFIKGAAFALRAGGRSPRVAKQFVELLAAGVKV